MHHLYTNGMGISFLISTGKNYVTYNFIQALWV